MKKILCGNEMNRMPDWAFRMMAFMFNVVVVYALDMFHMVKDTDSFLKELIRITKPEGVLYLEYGHQPGEKAKEKVNRSGSWTILEETKRYLKCVPVNP
ncbi:MAG: methyltransferase domain-containing protein [Bacteroidetes bacterium]|nr:methyltransferase domain-containing protein [Bacteroidota bacterium]